MRQSVRLSFVLSLTALLAASLLTGCNGTRREGTEEPVTTAAPAAKQGGPTTVHIFHRHEGDDFACPAHHAHEACNNTSHWLIAIRANYYSLDTITQALDFEAKLEPGGTPGKDGKVSSQRHVMIHADEGAPDAYVRKVIEACAAVGIDHVEVAPA